MGSNKIRRVLAFISFYIYKFENKGKKRNNITAYKTVSFPCNVSKVKPFVTYLKNSLMGTRYLCSVNLIRTDNDTEGNKTNSPDDSALFPCF
jgi:hypothetical protein